jgi:hypothetical protein
MSSASVTNNFTNGLIGDADQVDQNFADLVSFLNTHVAHTHNLGDAVSVTTLTPGANTDATTGSSFADWLTFPSVTVPSWATKGTFAVMLPSIWSFTADSTYDFRLQLGGTNGSADHQLRFPSSNDRAFNGWGGQFTGLTSGSKTVKVQASRLSGTGQMRADASSHMTIIFWWSA